MARYRFRFVFIPVGAIALGITALVHACSGPPGPVSGDFRDPAVLARALSAALQEKGDGTPNFSSCTQAVFPDYVCSVGFAGGTVATYQVTVAADGTSWHTD